MHELCRQTQASTGLLHRSFAKVKLGSSVQIPLNNLPAFVSEGLREMTNTREDFNKGKNSKEPRDRSERVTSMIGASSLSAPILCAKSVLALSKIHPLMYTSGRRSPARMAGR